MKRILSVIIVILLIILVGFLIIGLLFNGNSILVGSDDKTSEKSSLRVIGEESNQVNDSYSSLGSVGYSNTIVFGEELCNLAGTCGDDGGRASGGGKGSGSSKEINGDDKDNKEPECELSSDCGTNFYEDNYCWFGNSYRLFNYYTCDNGCSEHARIEKVEDCLVGCDKNTGNCFIPECTDDSECGDLQVCDVGNTYQCVDVECVDNSDCDDNDDYTQNLCVGAGEIDSYCEYTPIVCNADVDCGVNDFVGDSSCGVEDNVFKDYLTWTCEEAGTVNSFCAFSLTPTLTDDCNDATETCFEGVCHTVTCFDDSSCDDGNALTIDNCFNAGQVDSYCDNVPFICNVGADCDDGNALTLDSCLYPGTLDSVCENTPIVCNVPTDCGTDAFIGPGFCGDGDDVFKDYIEWTCENPGTILSSCSSSTAPLLFEVCPKDCLNGVCGTITCSENTDCDDGNALTLDSCLYPGTFSSSCENTVISCNLDIDCGINDFIGDRSCNNGDVWQDYKTFTCSNPGTVLSSCSSSTAPQIVEGCDIGCYEGECINEICDNGIDDDNDGLIDGLVEGLMGGQTTVKPQSVVTSSVLNSDDLISWIWNKPAAIRFDDASATRVCNIAGYENLVSKTKHYAGTKQRCFWSPEDNSLLRWDSSTSLWYETQAASNYGSVNAHCIEKVVCSDKFPDCRDGLDNDKDGKIDYCDGTNPDTCDIGCASADDNSEIGHDIECVFGDFK